MGFLIILLLQLNSLKSHITTYSHFIHMDRREGKGIDCEAGQGDLPSLAASFYKAL